ncbi:hypothetical protein [Ekhidna sp.]
MKRITYLAILIATIFSCRENPIEQSKRNHELEVSDVKAHFESEKA